ncbi:hypothetical protein IGI04_014624 [Brassica rapa subsp. trilocularis]|uniref:Uncharacterized protein n=1 Tax=Brassica rapa subsp. trilocularis TaxID=1813537 RepID=A0ABQ7MMV6_BRACM|nr:hypothetical protein IGI04_014624 [Brassica rapa subsp. trilocularis]
MADLRVSRHPQTTSIDRTTYETPEHQRNHGERRTTQKHWSSYVSFVEQGLEGESTTTTYETAR